MQLVTTSGTCVKFITKVRTNKFCRKWFCGTRIPLVVKTLLTTSRKEVCKIITWLITPEPILNRTTSRNSRATTLTSRSS